MIDNRLQRLFLIFSFSLFFFIQDKSIYAYGGRKPNPVTSLASSRGLSTQDTTRSPLTVSTQTSPLIPQFISEIISRKSESLSETEEGPLKPQSCLVTNSNLVGRHLRDLVETSHEAFRHLEGHTLATSLEPSTASLSPNQLIASLQDLRNTLLDGSYPAQADAIAGLIGQLEKKDQTPEQLKALIRELENVIQLLYKGALSKSLSSHPSPKNLAQSLLKSLTSPSKPKLNSEAPFPPEIRGKVLEILQDLLLFAQYRKNEKPETQPGGLHVTQPALEITFDYLKLAENREEMDSKIIDDGFNRNLDHFVIIGLGNQPKTIRMLREDYIRQTSKNPFSWKPLRDALNKSSPLETKDFSRWLLGKIEKNLEANYSEKPGFEGVDFKELAVRMMMGVHQNFWAVPKEIEKEDLQSETDSKFTSPLLITSRMDLNTLQFSGTQIMTVKDMDHEEPSSFFVPIVLRAHYDCAKSPRECGNEARLDFLPLAGEPNAFHETYDVRAFLARSPIGRIAQHVFKTRPSGGFLDSHIEKTATENVEHILSSYLNLRFCPTAQGPKQPHHPSLESILTLSLSSEGLDKTLQNNWKDLAVSKYISKTIRGHLYQLMQDSQHSQSEGSSLVEEVKKKTEEILSDVKKDFPSTDRATLERLIVSRFKGLSQEISAHTNMNFFAKGWSQECEKAKAEQKLINTIGDNSK